MEGQARRVMTDESLERDAELAHRHTSPSSLFPKLEHASAPRAGVLASLLTAQIAAQRPHCSIYLAGDVAA